MIKQTIKELNVIFKRMGWKLLSENNKYDTKEVCQVFVIISNTLYLDRSLFSYEEHLNGFDKKQLDKYITEFIRNVCLKHRISTLYFGDSMENFDGNKITIK